MILRIEGREDTQVGSAVELGAVKEHHFPGLDIVVNPQKKATVLTLSGAVGNLNFHSLEAVFEATRSSASFRLVIDLTSLHYLSAEGLAKIASTVKFCRANSGDARLVVREEVDSHVKKVLDLSGLNTVIQIFQTQEEAVTSF